MSMGPSILITGGTGACGRLLVAAALKSQVTQRVIVYSRDEAKQADLRGQFADERLQLVIGDIRDRERLRRALRGGVDAVIHAAAMKGVEACERNPLEAIATNVNGADNLVEAAIDCGVPKVLALSSDAAVEPTSFYGATKMCMERILLEGNRVAGPKGTRFSCVRFSSVAGSRGSLLPQLSSQSESGSVTLADERMTRFWVGLDKAIELIQASVRRMFGGEVFVPRVPAVRLAELARALAPECQLRFNGLAPGERLHEVLIGRQESVRALRLSDMFVILPRIQTGAHSGQLVGERLPADFELSSATGEEQLGAADLPRIVSEFERLGTPGGRRTGDHPWAEGPRPRVGLEVR